MYNYSLSVLSNKQATRLLVSLSLFLWTTTIPFSIRFDSILLRPFFDFKRKTRRIYRYAIFYTIYSIYLGQCPHTRQTMLLLTNQPTNERTNEPTNQPTAHTFVGYKQNYYEQSISSMAGHGPSVSFPFSIEGNETKRIETNRIIRSFAHTTTTTIPSIHTAHPVYIPHFDTSTHRTATPIAVSIRYRSSISVRARCYKRGGPVPSSPVQSRPR
mmetsp:Transcript_20365/g.43073  ORF Transcript_20365/g.43073 Transcript_20365/m.43073 type:complete len:214 (-) Transcript_20365:847-1488(-)